MISGFRRGLFGGVKIGEGRAWVWDRLLAWRGQRGCASGVGAARRAQESPRSLGLKHAAKGAGAMGCQEKRMAGELLGCVSPNLFRDPL